MVRVLLVYVYVPAAALVTTVHFPYDTDASPVRESKSAARFYEAAYRPADGAVRGVDYETTAAEAARKYDIEGQVRSFVTRYGLDGKRVLDVGSGRGYLQDVRSE